MTLHGDHHISLVQHKHCNPLWVNELVLGTPVEDGARCSDDNLLLQLSASLHWAERINSCGETSNTAAQLKIPFPADSRGTYHYSDILTSAAPNGVRQLHIRTKFPHLLNYLSNLQSQLVCRWDAKSLREEEDNFYRWFRYWMCRSLQVDNMMCLPEASYWLCLHGWAWPKKKQQFYQCLTVTGRSDPEVWNQRKNWMTSEY